jgi:hypothetical protein
VTRCFNLQFWTLPMFEFIKTTTFLQLVLLPSSCEQKTYSVGVTLNRRLQSNSTEGTGQAVSDGKGSDLCSGECQFKFQFGRQS